MENLNYHHLYYFWMVVREGGITAASRALHIGRPAISMQVKSLEDALGEPLFERRGRRLELTEIGRVAHGYAEEIFRTGRELLDAVQGRASGRSRTFRVGIADVMAKLVAFRLLLPALDDDEPVTLECVEDHPDRLFASLALHELDLVLSDVPLREGIEVRAFNHEIGSSTITLFAPATTARRLRRRFPESLEGEPFLMPARSTAIRLALEAWLTESDLRPKVIGEFEDSALMNVFGQAGRGVFPAPTVVSEEIQRQFSVRPVGELESVAERFYAISPERRIRHPATALIVRTAKESLFG